MVLNDKYAFYFCFNENTLFLLAKMTQDTVSLLSVTVQKWCIYFYFKISSFQEGNYICNGNNLIFLMMCYNLTDVNGDMLCPCSYLNFIWNVAMLLCRVMHWKKISHLGLQRLPIPR